MKLPLTYDDSPMLVPVQIGRSPFSPRTPFVRLCPVIVIEGEEYETCEEAAKDRWSNQKEGVWGRGLIPEAVLYGLFGETALAKYSGHLAVDLTYREGGDQTDFIIHDFTVNVKNSKKDSTGHEDGVGLIKTNQLIQDIFSFTHILEIDESRKEVGIALLGWIFKDEILELHKDTPGGIICPARVRRSRHNNYEVPLIKTNQIDTMF